MWAGEIGAALDRLHLLRSGAVYVYVNLDEFDVGVFRVFFAELVEAIGIVDRQGIRWIRREAEDDDIAARLVKETSWPVRSGRRNEEAAEPGRPMRSRRFSNAPAKTIENAKRNTAVAAIRPVCANRRLVCISSPRTSVPSRAEKYNPEIGLGKTNLDLFMKKNRLLDRKNKEKGKSKKGKSKRIALFTFYFYPFTYCQPCDAPPPLGADDGASAANCQKKSHTAHPGLFPAKVKPAGNRSAARERTPSQRDRSGCRRRRRS